MMKYLITILLISPLISIALEAQKPFTSATDSLSYSLGVLVGNNLKSGGFSDINLEIFQQGVNSAMKGEKSLIATEQCQRIVQEYAKEKEMKTGSANRAAGEQYLANNKLRKEVTTLPDGLQYEILKAAEGAKPAATDNVLVHYHGTLIDGTVFDSSVDRGEPIEFPLNGVIKGWTEILQLMPVGSKWKVYIPYQLAYGDRSPGGSIEPYSMLIFEIELLAIK
jgi:FKBP-type peptidyl-prolyl cis-trans isomerase FklB